ARGGATRTLKEVLLALVGEMGDTSAYRLDRVVVFEGARSRTVDARGVMSAGGRGEYLRPGAVIIIPEAGSVSYGMETAERSCSTKGRE
ncbi:MAG: hypothetical protein JW909_12885, partial [Planctomycetes bacterium]|nr:hypothetical protein [Planctomycetota bacterium]